MKESQKKALIEKLGQKEFDAIFNEGLKNGVWYKVARAQAKKTDDDHGGFGCWLGTWKEGGWNWGPEMWQPMTEEEIKETLLKRCKELGLLDNPFKCLTFMGTTSSNGNGFSYLMEHDYLFYNGNCMYENGTFATPIKKKMIPMCDLKRGQYGKTESGDIVTKAHHAYLVLNKKYQYYSGVNTTKVELLTEPFTLTFTP